MTKKKIVNFLWKVGSVYGFVPQKNIFFLLILLYRL